MAFPRATVLLVALWPVAAPADAPLPVPAAYDARFGGHVVAGDPAADTTTVRSPGEPDWVIPTWLRAPALSPDGRHLLAPQDGVNLLSDPSPDTVVFRIWTRPGPVAREVTVAELPDADLLPATASHVVLYTGIDWEDGGWTVTLGHGGQVRIVPAP